MKQRIKTLIVLLSISFSLFAQDLSQFKVPEKIKTVVNKRAMEILNSSKLEKLTISFLEANDVLTVELDKEKMPTNLKSEKVEIRLYDKMANLKKTKSFHGYSTTLNMNGLKPDVYLLQIKIGDKIVEEKIIVSER